MDTTSHLLLGSLRTQNSYPPACKQSQSFNWKMLLFFSAPLKRKILDTETIICCMKVQLPCGDIMFCSLPKHGPALILPSHVHLTSSSPHPVSPAHLWSPASSRRPSGFLQPLCFLQDPSLSFSPLCTVSYCPWYPRYTSQLDYKIPKAQAMSYLACAPARVNDGGTPLWRLGRPPALKLIHPDCSITPKQDDLGQVTLPCWASLTHSSSSMGRAGVLPGPASKLEVSVVLSLQQSG